MSVKSGPPVSVRDAKGMKVKPMDSVKKRPQVLSDSSGVLAHERLLSLLKEYAGKLNRLAQEHEQLVMQSLKDDSKANLSSNRILEASRQQLERMHSYMSPSILDLSRQASQIIEHGKVKSEVDRLELKLRLAELDLALERVGTIYLTVS